MKSFVAEHFFQTKNIKIGDIKTEVLAGFTVSLTLAFPAIGFSLLIGVDPIIGLQNSVIMGVILSILGGRPGMITAMPGALAAVLVGVVDLHGLEYLWAAVFVAGCLQIFASVLKITDFVRIIPYPVTLGFVNGVGIVIFNSQLTRFFAQTPGGEWGIQLDAATGMLLFLTMLTILIIIYFPKLSKSIPANLVAILSITGLCNLFSMETAYLKDITTISSGLSSFHIPQVPLTWETLKLIFPFSVSIALVSLIFSLLTMHLVDEFTDSRGSGPKESLALGIANIVGSCTGCLAGSAMLGQSMINLTSGGRGKLSSLVAASSLMFLIMFGSEFVGSIPVATIMGVMMVIAYKTFAWSSIRMLHKIPMSDAFVIVLVSALTVIFDLAVAIGAGVLISSVVFAWNTTKSIEVKCFFDHDGFKHYELYGPLYFGSVKSFKALFDVVGDPDEIFIDFSHSRICDHSAIAAINYIGKKYSNIGKKIHLEKLSSSCTKLIDQAGKMVTVSIINKAVKRKFFRRRSDHDAEDTSKSIKLDRRDPDKRKEEKDRRKVS